MTTFVVLILIIRCFSIFSILKIKHMELSLPKLKLFEEGFGDYYYGARRSVFQESPFFV